MGRERKRGTKVRDRMKKRAPNPDGAATERKRTVPKHQNP